MTCTCGHPLSHHYETTDDGSGCANCRCDHYCPESADGRELLREVLAAEDALKRALARATG